MNYNINKGILGFVVLVLFITPCVISQNNDTIVFKQNDSIPAGYWWVKKKSRVFSSKIYLTSIIIISQEYNMPNESFRAKTRVLVPKVKFEIFRWMYRSASLESNPLLFVIF